MAQHLVAQASVRLFFTPSPCLSAGPLFKKNSPGKLGFDFAAIWGIFNARAFVRDICAAKRAAGQPVISFEFFPPRTPEWDCNLLDKTIPALRQAPPDYCSATYRAGGSTRDKTLLIVDRIQRQHGLIAVAHLTCVDATREQIGGLLGRIRALGVKNVLALRGDPPDGGQFKATPGRFDYSSQLVRFIREEPGLCIGVAGFPEGHIACKEGKYIDWQHLEEKVDAGAEDAAAAEFGTDCPSKQCADLLQSGAPGLHFYTRNKARATTRVLQNLGLAQCPAGPEFH
jgi:5,10-methylenetetrahydrofolate reductase